MYCSWGKLNFWFVYNIRVFFPNYLITWYGFDSYLIKKKYTIKTQGIEMREREKTTWSEVHVMADGDRDQRLGRGEWCEESEREWE